MIMSDLRAPSVIRFAELKIKPVTDTAEFSRQKRSSSLPPSPVSPSALIPFARLPSISTPSPSARADGEKVDQEVDKLRRLSAEFAKKKREDFENHIFEHERRSRSRSPSLTKEDLKAIFSRIDNLRYAHYKNNNNNNFTKHFFMNGFDGLNNNTLPRYFNRAKSPVREISPARSLPSSFRGRSPTKTIVEKEKPFLPLTLPDLPSYKMPSSTPNRRFSEEAGYRKPLATLHEDEAVARRRFSEEVRKKSFDTTQVLDDIYKQQRRLSEAGIRRLSDASVILTEDTDNFIIGDRVWVGGTKPGSISYIGETQFAPGEWAGITLDDPIGKNDGSVAGIRYFQCAPGKGIFSRLTRLSRRPLSDHDLEILASRSSLSPKPNGISPTAVSSPTSSSSGSNRKTIPTGLPVAAPANAISFSKPTTPTITSVTSSKKPEMNSGGSNELKIGENVVVNSTNGIKFGVLRYLGKTDFAEGFWAGVELDCPAGKNDGSVAGKKYFICKPKYGLFAPITRVSRFTGYQTPRRPSSTVCSRASGIRRSNSRESLGAVSATSVASSKGGTRKLSRPLVPSISNAKALQDALDEKTHHVDQLLHERDMERGEVARMAEEASNVAQALQIQLNQLQMESEERLHDMQEKISLLEQERSSLISRLEDRQKELDDITFRLEEEVICKTDLESLSATDADKIKELESKLQKQKLFMQKSKEEIKDQVGEMEDLELQLRSTIDDMQAQIMEEEKQREMLEKQIEERNNKLISLEATNIAIQNKLNEREQKIALLMTNQEANHNEQILLLKQELESIHESNAELEKFKAMFKEYEENSKCAEEKYAKEKMEKEKVELEMIDIHSKFCALEKDVSKLNKSLSLKRVDYEKLQTENAALAEQLKEGDNLHQMLHEKDALLDDLTEKIATLEITIKNDKANSVEVDSVVKALEDEHLLQLKNDSDKLSEIECLLNKKNEEMNSLANNLKISESHAAELEASCAKLEEQLSSALSSSSDSSEKMIVFSNRIKDVEHELCDAQRKLSEKEAELELEIERYKVEKNSLLLDINKKQGSFEDAVARFNKEIVDLNDSKSIILEAHEKILKEKDTLIQEVENKMDLNVSQLTEKVQIMQKEYFDIKSKYSEKVSECEKLQSQSEEFEKQSVELLGVAQKLKDIEIENGNLKNKLLDLAETHCSENRVLREQNEHLAKEKKELREHCDLEIHTYLEKQKCAESLLNEKNNEISALTYNLKLSESHVKELESSSSRLAEQVNSALSSSSDSSDKLVALNKQIKDIEQQLHNARGMLLEKETELEQEIVRNRKAREMLEEVYKKEKCDLENTIIELNQGIDELKRGKILLDANIAKLKKDNIEELEVLKKNKDLEIFEIQEKLHNMEVELSELKQLVTNYEDKNKNLSSSNEDLENKLHEQASVIEKMEKIEKENTIFREKYDTLSETLDREKSILSSQNCQLLKEIDKLKCENSLSAQSALEQQKINNEVIQKKEQEISVLKEKMLNLESELKDKNEKMEESNHIVDKLCKDFEAGQRDLELNLEKIKKNEGERQILVQELNDAKESMDHLRGTINSLEEQKSSLELSYKQSLLEIGKIKSCEENLLSLVSEKDKQLEAFEFLKRENEKIRAILLVAEDEIKALNNVVQESEKIKEDYKQLNSQVEHYKDREVEFESLNNKTALLGKEKEFLIEKANGLEEKLKFSLKSEASKDSLLQQLNMQLTKYESIEISCQQYQASNDLLTNQIEELKNRYDSQVMDLKTEKVNLIEEIVTLEEKLSYAKENVEKAFIEAENARLISRDSNLLRKQVKNLMDEKKSLEVKLIDLQVELSSSNIQSSPSDNFVTSLRNEKEQLEAQVKFLNSVIVDMQRKNDELKEKLQVIECEMLYGPDDMKEEVQAVALRLYCDICECFDLHDTEDCPKQESSSSPPHTQFHGIRGSERPFCTLCEQFGHDTADCTEEYQTF